jgi:heme oxygenase (biliverdin-producing, ferredoxin)
MTAVTPDTRSRLGLAALLREGSRHEHRSAEGQAFVGALLAGRVSASGYLAFLTRLAAVYNALESVGAALAEDAYAGAVVDPALHRAAALRDDLGFWWRAAGHDAADLDVDGEVGRVAESSPASTAYVDRVLASAQWGGLYVAHHYTRYLGDLSGGQAMGRALTRTFDLPEREGVRFFSFTDIPRVKPYKDGYRARLDALPVDDEGRDRMLAEVKVAFALNEALFAELQP